MMRFDCTLHGHGWFAAQFSNETEELTLCVSYLSDAPRDFLASIALLFEGKANAECRWQDEPGEYRLQLARKDDVIVLRILSLKDSFSRLTDIDGNAIFNAITTCTELGKAVRNAFRRLAQQYSATEYEALWGHPYPQSEIQRLNSSLK